VRAAATKRERRVFIGLNLYTIIQIVFIYR
jgi:hypothetical protein